ncbi:general secretion pathway protein GspB [Geobacter sp. AOG1]|uniref:general secretion pathway protein GspB n=1 Tax=Geobacter sp. AOG1 TaxID=1566346 RepID=UPI001CC39909|nr:general secretion pathway protein GspB [Geobacter sp. AOG1]GFE57923.1 hypothetical protein AOG1_18030 [Geobacter sp. AOG1]
MSSILKALQKLEQEKSSRRQVAPDVAVDIVKPPAPKHRSPWLIPGAMAGVTLLAVLITYAAMGGFARTGPKPVAIPPIGTLPEKVAASVPPVVSPTPAVRLPATSLPASQKRQAPPMSLPATRAVASKSAPLPPQQVVPQPESPVQAPPTVPAKMDPVSPPAAPPLPTLKVTGIAWDKDSSSRLAMVNGAAVAQGGMVEGARVEEIYPDRVRFAAGKRSFEVPLGKSSADR